MGAPMKRCPQCDKQWPLSHAACPDDGTPLPHGTEKTLHQSGGARVTSSGGVARVRVVGGENVSDELQPGLMVGEYRVERKLGEGAMGVVYGATHPLIGKQAAIKVISQALSASREAVERFVQEARAVNQIGHPNIVDIFSFGLLEDGRSYFVMELLKGRSLDERLRQGKPTLHETLEMLEQACRALEAAHGKGIIHRDLKPANVFLVELRDEPPIVKLVDFGLAKLARGDDARVERTQTGVMMGTPLYIAPEQARGKPVDGRSDIYALGVMAYEMVLGQVPFLGDSVVDIIFKHINEPPPPPRSLWPEIPEPLEQLLLAMLAKDPAARPTLAEIRGTLADLYGSTLTDSGSRPVPLRTWPLAKSAPRMGTQSQSAPAARRSRVLLAVPIGFAVLAGLGVALLRKPSSPPELPVKPAAAPTPAAPSPAPPAVSAAGAPPSAPAPPPAAAPAAAAPEANGTLIVRVNTAAARITVDGHLVADPADMARTTTHGEGRHEVEVTAPGHRPFHGSVIVGAGATVELPVKLAHPGTAPAAAAVHAPKAPATATPPPAPAKKNRDDVIDPFAAPKGN
jgi:serine/threonine-protein kinase